MIPKSRRRGRRESSSRVSIVQNSAPVLSQWGVPSGWVLVAQILMLVALCVLANLQSLSGGFVWDDADVITQGVIRSPHALRNIWWSTKTPDYWPVAYTSLWIDWQLWGESPLPFRAVNVALHALNALLMWRILRQLNVPGAWLCATVFAVHPVTVEAVAWILQRKTLLATTFAFGSLLAWLESWSTARRTWYLLSLVLFAIGMLCKTSIIVWPAVLLLCRWWQTRKITGRDLALASPFFVVTLLLGAVGLWFQHTIAIGHVVVRDDGFLSRSWLAGRVVWFYLGKALWPVDLAFIYPRWKLEPTGWQAWLPDAALIALFALLWHYRRTWGAPALAALSYYVLNLIPVLGFIDIYFMRYSLVADHWQYLALPGVIALVVGSATYLATSANLMQLQWLFRCAAVGVVIALTWQANAQSAIYSGTNNGAQWRDTLAKNPECWLARVNLGSIYVAAKRVDAAQGEFNQAIVLAPKAAEPYFNLGRLLTENGQFDAAIANLQKSVQLNPDMAAAHQWLGEAHSLSKQEELALVEFNRVLELMPGEAEAYFGMVRVYRSQSRHPEALATLREAGRMRPHNAVVHAELAQELRVALQDADAIKEFRRALDCESLMPAILIVWPGPTI